MEINIQEILAKHSKNYDLALSAGRCQNTTLTGLEAHSAIREIVEAVLLEASNNAEVELRIYNSKGEYKFESLGQEISTEREKEYYGASKESITSVINKVKF